MSVRRLVVTSVLAAALLGARATGAQAPTGESGYRGVWFGIAIAGAGTRARCDVLCESGSGFSAGYSAAVGAAVTPRVLVGADVELANPICVDCSSDFSPIVALGAATVRVLLAPAPKLTGESVVRPVARVGLGGYVYRSGNAKGPAGDASGLALVGGLAFDIPLDAARRRFTRIGSIAPFLSYTHALSGRMRYDPDSDLGAFDVAPSAKLRLDVVHVGLAVVWH